jgi:uncharacterized protein YihD (DUF1040 family)
MKQEQAKELHFNAHRARDPARIPEILDMLGQVWTSNPDLRLTQLIVNVAHLEEPCPILYYKEDDVILDGLIQYQKLTNGG